MESTSSQSKQLGWASSGTNSPFVYVANRLRSSNVPTFNSYIHTIKEFALRASGSESKQCESIETLPELVGSSHPHYRREFLLRNSVTDPTGSTVFSIDPQGFGNRQFVPESSIRHIFGHLRDTWKSDTKFESSASKITSHPAYKLIIAMGPSMIPYIIEEVRSGSRHWYYALRQITGCTPPNATNLNSDELREIWLRWEELKTSSPAKRQV